MRSGTLLRSAALTLSLALGACGGGDDGGSFSPTMANVAGTYHATTFSAGSGATAIDLLAAGATVNVTLTSGGSTSGHLSVPAAVTGGASIDEDLAGTWTLTGNTVTFNQTSGTLIQNAPFSAAEENTLTSTGTFNGLSLLIVLSKG